MKMKRRIQKMRYLDLVWFVNNLFKELDENDTYEKYFERLGWPNDNK